MICDTRAIIIIFIKLTIEEALVLLRVSSTRGSVPTEKIFYKI